MSNEEIVKEIDEATNLMTEAKVKMNVALNLARGAIVKGNAVDTEAYNKGLEDGRNEVWELVKKLSEMPNLIAKEIFGYEFLYGIVINCTPQEALAKLEAYEKEQEEKRKAEEMAVINVGDVVEYDGVQAVVMDIDLVDNVALFTENACIESWLPQCTCKKTGKHIDIQSVLAQIGGGKGES